MIEKCIQITTREYIESGFVQKIMIPFLYTNKEMLEETFHRIKEQSDLINDKYKESLNSTLTIEQEQELKDFLKKTDWAVNDSDAISYKLISLLSGETEEKQKEIMEEYGSIDKNCTTLYDRESWESFLKIKDGKGNYVIMSSNWTGYGQIVEKIEVIDKPENFDDIVEGKSLNEVFDFKTEFPFYWA